MRRLILRPGATGDCILALPAMEALRAGYTEVWVAERNVPLIRFADRVRSIASTGIEMAGFAGHALAALEGFDSIVSWYGTNRPEFRALVQHLPFAFHQALPPTGCAMHAADFFFEQATGRRERVVPRIDVPRTNGGYTVIHPFSGSAKKNWPLERFREVARAIEGPVHWCAGPEEPLEDAVRFDDLYELARWLAGARLYIGNDSGISHLAAAVGTPVVALFGPTDPAVWAPRGKQVRIVRAAGPAEAIPVASVVEAVHCL